MIKVVDLVYYHHAEYHTPQQVLEKHGPSLGFADFISSPFQIQFVKHLDYEGFKKIKKRNFAFFRSVNRFWHIPFKTHRYIKSQNPDIVLVEGLVFPIQLMLLKLSLGRKCRVVAQHHGEEPFDGIKSIFQKLADKFISAYFFTSNKNASPWIRKKIIKNPDKCLEVLESSTYFTRQDKLKSQVRLGIKGLNNFLWVGRLNKNKDPLTVLRAFKKYGLFHPDAKLYMIYQDETLLEEIKMFIWESVVLEDAVVLVGKVDHRELRYWFSAVDYYISGSHKVGNGYALLEAMACGCIPLVTTIPSFEKITSKGKFGYLYPPGNDMALTLLLEKLHNKNTEFRRQEVENYFRENLSFKRIADDICRAFGQLYNDKTVLQES